jgi:hypothetical protein
LWNLWPSHYTDWDISVPLLGFVSYFNPTGGHVHRTNDIISFHHLLCDWNIGLHIMWIPYILQPWFICTVLYLSSFDLVVSEFSWTTAHNKWMQYYQTWKWLDLMRGMRTLWQMMRCINYCGHCQVMCLRWMPWIGLVVSCVCGSCCWRDWLVQLWHALANSNLTLLTHCFSCWGTSYMCQVGNI